MTRAKRTVTPRDDRRRNGEIRVTQADRGCWREAMLLAGGDARRLEVHRDGSVTVHNHPRR